jgi:hypothetical protein
MSRGRRGPLFTYQDYLWARAAYEFSAHSEFVVQNGVPQGVARDSDRCIVAAPRPPPPEASPSSRPTTILPPARPDARYAIYNQIVYELGRVQNR